MTTDKAKDNRFIKDMGAVFTPVFYIFAIVAIASALIAEGFLPHTIITAIFLVLLAAAASADIEKGIVPDMVCCLIAILAIADILIAGDYAVKTIADHLTGALCLSLLMLLCTLIVKGGFGGGDIKLMAASGLFLAFDNTLLGAFIAFLIAGVYSLILLIKNGREGLGRSKIRLAPFLALGLGFAALYGDQALLLLKLASRHIFLGN